MELDGFQLVRPRRCSRKSNTRVPKIATNTRVSPKNGATSSARLAPSGRALYNSACSKTSKCVQINGTEADTINQDVVLKKIFDCQDEIQRSEFYNQMKIVFSVCEGDIKSQSGEALGNRWIKEIVCYGLGHFATCLVPRYQLALLLSLKSTFDQNVTIYVYDPVFAKSELEILIKLGLSIITENEEAKRPVSEHTLFYLPHCGRPLYNNLLWANWKPECLRNVLILGNSFQHVTVAVPMRMLLDKCPYIVRVDPVKEEKKVPNCFTFADIFNNMSLHWFPKRKVEAVGQEFWSDCSEPHYELNDAEFITKQMSSMLCKD